MVTPRQFGKLILTATISGCLMSFPLVGQADPITPNEPITNTAVNETNSNQANYQSATTTQFTPNEAPADISPDVNPGSPTVGLVVVPNDQPFSSVTDQIASSQVVSPSPSPLGSLNEQASPEKQKCYHQLFTSPQSFQQWHQAPVDQLQSNYAIPVTRSSILEVNQESQPQLSQPLANSQPQSNQGSQQEVTVTKTTPSEIMPTDYSAKTQHHAFPYHHPLVLPTVQVKPTKSLATHLKLDPRQINILARDSKIIPVIIGALLLLILSWVFKINFQHNKLMKLN